MGKNCLITLLLLALLDAPSTGITVQGRVTRVIDGDTVEVEEVPRVWRVRLLDCWAPESRIDPRVTASAQGEQKLLGLASKKHLEELALNKECVLQVPDPMKPNLNRFLGHVYIDGKSIAESQVTAGHATKERP
jgi:endonuclease YncB( thermonuclease family)